MSFRAVRFWVPIVALAAVNLLSQYFYVDRSRAITPGTFSEIPFFSDTHALDFFQDRRRAWADTVFTDTLNYSAARIQIYYLNPSQVIYLASDRYDWFGPAVAYCRSRIVRKTLPCLFPPRNLFASSDQRMNDRRRFFRSLDFRFFPRARGKLLDGFVYDVRADDVHLRPNSQIVESFGESVLNRWPNIARFPRELYRVRTSSELTNHLIFVPATLGSIFGIGSGTSLFDIEPDLFYPNNYFSTLGRYLLFRVLSPSHRFRFELSVSATLKDDGKDQLPKAVIVGAQRVKLPLIGRGSARIFSELVSPQKIDGMSFLGLDMGSDAMPIVQAPRTNLMKLYGTSVRLDSRNVTVFARDLSLVDDAKYRTLSAPGQVSAFPRDLANPNLEFSGVYEDGWLSENSYFVLRPRHKNVRLKLDGLVPLIKQPQFQTSLCVSIDHTSAGCHIISVGYFTFFYQLKNAKNTNHRIDVHFDRHQVLPSGDRRPVGMKLQYIGFDR
jgi:hypothetical protein